jgi:dipeptidyl aminopeptidase/acylaminoacyl peptidase
MVGMKPALTPSDLLLWRNAGSLALSPDGSRLAFCEMWCEDDANKMAIFVVPSDGSEPARRITFGPKGDRGPKWSPDGTKLAFLSVRETDWRSDLYVMNMAAGGDPELVATLPRGIGEFAWSPDGTRFALTGRPDYPGEGDFDERRKAYNSRVVFVDRLHFRADGNQLTDDDFPWLWVCSLGGSPEPVVESTTPLHSPGWTPDGRLVFLSSRDADHELTWNTQLWTADGERLSHSAGQVMGYDFTADGRAVYTAYPVPGLPVGCFHDQLWIDDAVVVLDENVGKHVLSDTIDPLAGSSTPTCDGNDIYVQISVAGAVHVDRYRDGAWERVLDGERVIGEFVVSSGVLAYSSTSATEPASLYVGDRFVHEPNPWIHDREWSEVRPADHAWVLSPPGGFPSDGAPPCVLAMHGGPHAAYGCGFNILLQMLAAPGFSVIVANPPGSMTYGEGYTQQTHKAWGEAELPVLMHLIDSVVADGLADPSRLGATGGSYGGFLTNVLISRTDRFKAAVSARGVANLTSIFGSSEFGWALMHGCFAAHPWEDRAMYERLSPTTYVENITTPTRFIACTDDFRVPMEQVEQMYIALKVLGRETDLVVFRDSHHLIYSGPPRNRVAHMEAIVEWFQRYL